MERTGYVEVQVESVLYKNQSYLFEEELWVHRRGKDKVGKYEEE